jgi:hypothetical protein
MTWRRAIPLVLDVVQANAGYLALKTPPIVFIYLFFIIRWPLLPILVTHEEFPFLTVKRMNNLFFCYSDMEKYDLYVSAELQMLELLSGDSGSPKSGEKVPSSTSHHSSTNSLNNNSNPRTTPTSIRSSPSSTFAKFFPVSPETLPQAHPVSP